MHGIIDNELENLIIQKSFYTFFTTQPSSELFFKQIHEKFEEEIAFLNRGDKKRDIDKETQT